MKFKKIFTLVGIIFLLMVNIGLAQDRVVRIDNPLHVDTFLELIKRIADVIFAIVTPMLVIMILIGAFYWVTAGSGLSEQSKQITKGKDIIKYAIIGFLIILGSKGFVEFLYNRFGYDVDLS